MSSFGRNVWVEGPEKNAGRLTGCRYRRILQFASIIRGSDKSEPSRALFFVCEAHRLQSVSVGVKLLFDNSVTPQSIQSEGVCALESVTQPRSNEVSGLKNLFSELPTLGHAFESDLQILLACYLRSGACSAVKCANF